MRERMPVRIHLLAMIVCVTAAVPARPGYAAGDEGYRIPSPIVAVGEAIGPGALPVEFEPRDFGVLRSAARQVWRGFPLAADREVDLVLHTVDPLASEAKVVVGSVDGDREIDPSVALLSGVVRGIPGSSVFIGLSERQMHGIVQLPEETFILSSGVFGAGDPPLIYSLTDLPPDAIRWHPFECRVRDIRDAGWELKNSPSDVSTPCRASEVAIESDWEYTRDVFGGDAEASAEYALMLFGAVSEIYIRDFNTSLRVSFLRVWEFDVDPYDGGNLDTFRDYWNSNMGHVPRQTAHLISGVPGGGVAYFPAICDTQWAYGVSWGVTGFFPYPLEHNRSQNWDPYVVSHEIGHNFGAPHTHEVDPPIDRCGLGDCTDSDLGTIMSYCHTCAGGMSNIRLEFHQRMITESVLPYLEDGAPCDLTHDPECSSTSPRAGTPTHRMR